MKSKFRFQDFFPTKFSFTVCLENVRVLSGSSDVPGLGHQNTDLLIGYSAVSI